MHQVVVGSEFNVAVVSLIGFGSWGFSVDSVHVLDLDSHAGRGGDVMCFNIVYVTFFEPSDLVQNRGVDCGLNQVPVLGLVGADGPDRAPNDLFVFGWFGAVPFHVVLFDCLANFYEGLGVKIIYMCASLFCLVYKCCQLLFQVAQKRVYFLSGLPNCGGGLLQRLSEGSDIPQKNLFLSTNGHMIFIS